MSGARFDHAGDRLRAIATITIFGGFASTVFLPLTGALVERMGWRPAVGVLAAGLALTTLAVHRVSFAVLERNPGAAERASIPHVPMSGHLGLLPMMAVFTASSFAATALAANLVPALMERGLSPTTAAAFGGLFGIMQLPGRVVFAKNSSAVTPMVLLGTSMGLQVAGLMTLAATHAPVGIGVGVALFACGSGLATVARPYLVLVFYGQSRAGEMNGVFARPQQLARAAGPVAAAALAGVTGYGWVFGLLAVLIAVVLAVLLGAPGTK